MLFPKRAAALTLVVFGVLSALAVAHPKGRWRAQTLLLKIRGDLPEFTLAEVLAAQLPNSWTQDQDPGLTGGLVSGDVIFNRRESSGPCPVVFDTPFGELHGRLSDGELLELLSREQLIDKAYDDSEVHVSAGDVVIDGGAHLGTFVKASLNRGARVVVAFEPEPTNADCLRRTFPNEIEQGRVVLKESALWHTPGTLTFEVESGGDESARGHVVDSGGLTVDAVTLDQVVDELGLETVDFIKMDIEGAERHALAGSRETLRRFTPKMALCVYHRRDDRQVLTEIVTATQPSYRISGLGNQLYFRP